MNGVDERLLGRALSREMIIHRVPEQVRKLVDLVRVLTVDHVPARDAAPVDDPADLDAALVMDRRDRERAEKVACELKILRVVRGGGRWWYELMPLPDAWPDRRAGRRTGGSGASALAPTFEREQEARDAWARLDRADVETAQRELPLPMRVERDGSEEGARNREAAMARERERVKLGEIPPKLVLTRTCDTQFGGNSPKTVGGNSPRLQTPARTRARHDHDHDPTSVPQSMVHDHEGMSHGRQVADGGENAMRAYSDEELETMIEAEGQYWLDQLPDIFGEASASQFRRTWLMRFADRYRAIGYRAIGEVKRMKSNGEVFKKGPGEAANYFFNKWRYAAFQNQRKEPTECHEKL